MWSWSWSCLVLKLMSCRYLGKLYLQVADLDLSEGRWISYGAAGERTEYTWSGIVYRLSSGKQLLSFGSASTKATINTLHVLLRSSGTLADDAQPQRDSTRVLLIRARPVNLHRYINGTPRYTTLSLISPDARSLCPLNTPAVRWAYCTHLSWLRGITRLQTCPPPCRISQAIHTLRSVRHLAFPTESPF